MPLTVALAHRLNQKMAELRRSGECAWLRPDSKTQVTIEHELRDGEVIPLRVHTVVISVQHSEDISLEDQREQLKSKVYINDEERNNTNSLFRLSTPLSPPNTSTRTPSTGSSHLASSSLAVRKVTIPFTS